MKERTLYAVPLFVAIALHAWASGAYATDVFVLTTALAAIPLGGRVPLGVIAQRVLGVSFFAIGAGIGWSHVPELGYGPGTLPRSASLVAVGSLLAATSRIYARASWRGERATFVLGMLAVAASGATRLGPVYGVFAVGYLACAFVALRARDVARARASDLGVRHYAALAALSLLASGIALGLTRAAPPLHDAVQRAFENAYTPHDMVGFGIGSDLGSLRDMIRSDTEVLRLTPPPHAPPFDYLRGAIYDDYRRDGFWSESAISERIRDVAVGAYAASPETAVRVRRVGGAASRYFVPLRGRELRVDSGLVDADELGTLFTVGSERAKQYSFVPGDRETLAPAHPRRTDLGIPPNERDLLRQLAREWTGSASSPSETLDQITSHLARDYRYSLTVQRDADDPLLDFLFHEKLGYCTYFASAMTMLARARGIPARLVTGYRVAEWSPVAREYVVREKNAHAWVEAWVGGAWRTYDPTPMQELPQDAPHMAALGTLAADGAARVGQAVAYAIAHVTPAQLVVALVALAALWGLVRALRKRGELLARRTSDEHADRPLPFFEQLAASLDRKGVARPPSEPLERFAQRLEAAGLAEAAALVSRYAAFRYGGVGELAPLAGDVARYLASPPAGLTR